MAHPSRSENHLRKRLSYFFELSARARTEVHEFAEGLLELGAVVVIGGMIRDLLLEGNRTFKSDVDFVVQPDSVEQFERIMTLAGARRNRFGGYSLELSRWKVEVWPLERTWAAVNGHVSVRTLEDLTRVTFFNWDAVVYSLADRRLVTAPSYFHSLNDKHLDVNLSPNPNPLGNAVRAIRYAARWHAGFGPALAEHVERQIADCGWSTLIEAERSSFDHRYLPRIDGDQLAKELRLCRSDRSCLLSIPSIDVRQGALFQ